MPLPDYIEVTQGTAIIWGEAGATGPTVTNTLSLDALANGAASAVWRWRRSCCRWRRKYL